MTLPTLTPAQALREDARAYPNALGSPSVRDLLGQWQTSQHLAHILRCSRKTAMRKILQVSWSQVVFKRHAVNGDRRVWEYRIFPEAMNVKAQ